MDDDRDIAPPKSSKAHATTVEPDDRRSVDRKPHPAAVELAEAEPGRSYPDDEAAVDGLRRGCTGRRNDQRDREHESEPDPSHAACIRDADQDQVCGL
jgi:hypothetical protein